LFDPVTDRDITMMSRFHTEVTERNSTIMLCHTFRNEPSLKMNAKNVEVPSPKIWVPKLPIFGWFYDTSVNIFRMKRVTDKGKTAK